MKLPMADNKGSHQGELHGVGGGVHFSLNTELFNPKRGFSGGYPIPTVTPSATPLPSSPPLPPPPNYRS